MTAVGTSVGMAIGAGGVGLLVQVTTHPEAYVFPLIRVIGSVVGQTRCR
jgi:hypothetical protein